MTAPDVEAVARGLTKALLPCPFCGGEAEMREWDFPYVRYQSRCVACKTTGRTRFNERAKAIAAWNRRRPTPPATDDEREGLAMAVSETARLCEQLDITNADHIALWLEANRDAGLPWLAVQIVEAHEAALRALAERMTDD